MARNFGPPWVLTSLTPANPLAGQPYTLTFAAGSWYHIIAAHFVLTSSAAVANRFGYSQFLDPVGNGAGIALSQSAQAASLAFSYQLAVNFPSVAVINSNQIISPLADIVVPETWQFQINAVNLQAGDQLSSIVIFYESLAYV